MKKNYILSFLICSVLSAQNGTKQLDIKECIWKARTEFAPKRPSMVQFVPGQRSFSFVRRDTLYRLSAPEFKLVPVLIVSKLNIQLKATLKDTLTSWIPYSWENENKIKFSFKNKIVTYSIPENKAEVADKKTLPTGENMDVFEEEKKFCYTRNYNLYVYDGEKEWAVTTDGTEDVVYGTSVHQNEFGITKGTFWSPKGNKVAFYKMDQSRVFRYPIVEWDSYPARSRTLIYPMNGTTSHTVQVGVYSLSDKKVIYLQTEKDEHYLTNLSWTPDEKYILLAEINRDQTHMKMNLYDASDGKFIRTLFEEKEDKYVEPQVPAIFVPSSPQQFVWLSQRSGYRHLYLYDLSGKLIKTLTSGKYEIKSLMGFDAKGQYLYFVSNEGNPIGQSVHRINIKSGKKESLTDLKGFHVPLFNKDFTLMIDMWTSVYDPGASEVVDLSDLKKVRFFNSDNPLKEYALGKWKVFSLKVPSVDSKEEWDLYARMFYPVGFDSTKKYPVLVYLYNGPHSQLVTDSWMGGGEVWYQFMAQQGFIVFTIDGRGTSWRGKEFEQVIYRRLGKNEMEDQLRGVKYLKSLNYVDSTRMGVFGWSYGGFMTISLMTRHPGVFRAAVAGGPVVDWRYYEIMYGERYMDTYETNKDGFEENSLLNHIQHLKGNLLVIHGALDPVVVWQHTMLLLRKAIEKGVHFDYYVYPHHEHNVLGKDRAHLMEKVVRYFITHLKQG
jgi:dipeptidyl-peptidase-4